MFDALHTKEAIIRWIKKQFEGTDQCAVIGMSGGKDSTIVARLCVEALGANRVYGVIMPNGTMTKLELAQEICECLNIRYSIVDISTMYTALTIPQYQIYPNDVRSFFPLSKDAMINIAPRLRMTTLYAFAQTLNGRVIGTSNLSEYYIGYFTKWADGVSDLNPIRNLTCSEVIELGMIMLPEKYVVIPPSDDLWGITDEDRWGFTYKILDNYIRTGKINDLLIKEKIDKMHNSTEHKRKEIPICEDIFFI